VLSILITQTVLAECIKSVKVDNRTSGLYMFATMLGIFASIIPFFELAGFKNRRNLDTLYFFPIKRESMALAHYISGFVQVMLIYTVTYVVGFFFLAAKTDCFALLPMLPYYFLSLLLGLVIYSIFMFLFTQANTAADGVLICLLWIFLLYIVSCTLFDVVWNSNEDMYWDSTWRALNKQCWGIIYAPINHLTVLFQDMIEINNPTRWEHSVDKIREQAYMFLVWGVIGIAAAVGYVVSFAKRKAEKAGEISNSWFGYKTLIPIYGYCLFFTMRSGSGLNILSLVFWILMIAGYIIYRRGFRFRTSDIVLIAIGFVLLFL
jgi:hypothetical protein